MRRVVPPGIQVVDTRHISLISDPRKRVGLQRRQQVEIEPLEIVGDVSVPGIALVERAALFTHLLEHEEHRRWHGAGNGLNALAVKVSAITLEVRREA